MNKIKTKSIHKRKHKRDGLRICVMRRIRSEYKFDIWIPELAPSEKLLKDYVITQKISWEEFKSKYQKQVLNKNKRLIGLLHLLSKKKTITLLCSEEDASYCHRRLILDELDRLLE